MIKASDYFNIATKHSLATCSRQSSNFNDQVAANLVARVNAAYNTITHLLYINWYQCWKCVKGDLHLTLEVVHQTATEFEACYLILDIKHNTPPTAH